MASINKLMLKGIRSFDPDKEATIHFYSPLTLIVGQNGAGKTTIIEALKYATTGDLPPNSKSGAFIYDPKIAKRNEITAQVRLGFQSLNGKQMECLRSIMLTKKRTTQTQKTLEAILYTYDKELGQQTSITARSSTLDTDMQLNLGVSKAILDNVIFCHQEESNWPLSEPSVLKKKFDDIFSATKYTKALESLKTSIKETKAKQKEYDAELKVTNDGKRKFERLQHDSESNLRDIEDKNSIISELEINLVTIETEVDNFQSELRERNKALERVKEIEKELIFHENTIKELDKNRNKMEGDKEQLLLMKQKEHHELERHEIQLNQLKNEQTKFNETIQSTRDKLSSLKSEQGKLQAIVENHNKIYEEKNLLLEKIKQNFANDELFDNNQVFDDDDQYTKFIIECLKNSLRNTNAEFKSNKESIRNKETQINQSLTELSSKLIKSKSDIISFNNSLKKIDLKMSDLHKEITTFDKEEAEVDTIKQKIETKKREIEVIKKEINEKKYTDLISEKNTKLMELEKELFTLSSQTVANNSTMENQIQIQILKIQRLNIEEQIKMIIEIYGQQFERVLNHMPLPRNAQRQVELAKSVKQDELKDTNTKLERYQKNQITAETKLTIYKTIMEEKKVKVNEYSKQCRMLCENASFPLVLQSIESELEELKRNVNELKGEDSAIRNHFSGFDNSEISTDNCPTCQQDIDPKIKKKLNLEYPNHLPKIRQLEKEIMNKELKLRELREFYPNFKLMKKIQNQEISELENELVINEANGKHFKNEYNKLKVIYETQLRDLEILLELSFVSKELEKADKLKDSLDIKLRRSNNNTINASPNSANEVNEDLPKLINELRNEIHQLKEELKEKEKKLIELEKEIQKFKEKLFHIHNKSQKKEENQKEIINLKKEKENLLKLIKESEKEKLEFEPQVEEKRKNINLIHEELDALDKMNQKKILKYQRYLNQLSQIQVTLDKSNILQRTEEQKLNQREQEENKSIIDEIQLKLQKVENEMEKIKNKINSTTSFERDIMDNINYLELNEKITELKKELITYNNLVNINEIAHLNRQLDQLKADSKNYENKKARLGGEVKMLKTQNLKIDAEIQSSYKNAHKEHQQQMVKCCINELTVKDLELYSKALDTAILKFHSIKMAEINRTIQDLWTETYYGSDIETIKISSDTENVRGGRSYNYRVVMVKDGAELDMRGRCSAGQKVLTSIIVRLALAEAFGSNCGILALDEPTTNLDKQNIQSLAESLGNIIEARQSQKNFQLVIITHDVEFTSHLSKSNFADYYWIVKKGENKTSTIQRNNIENLYEDQ